MEPRFIRWALLLLLLTIAATEGLRGPSSRIDGDNKPAAVRGRGTARFSSKSSSEPTSDSTTLTPDSTTTKASRRGPVAARRSSYSRASPQTITTTTGTSTEQTTIKLRTEAAITRTLEKSKPSPQKLQSHGPGRFVSRKLVSKTQVTEPAAKNQLKDSKDISKDTKDRRYLPDGLSDSAKNARAQGQIEGIEAPKVADSPRTGSRRPVRLTQERTKQKLESPEPSVFAGLGEQSRSRTGRKIQSNSVLSARQLKSNVPSSPKFSRDKTTTESEVNPTTEPIKASRRSFKNETPDFRKKLTDSSSKQDITASGSESVRINIPLNFEESRRLGSSGATNDVPTTEASRRSISSRYKPRGRQASSDRKAEIEVTTSGNPTSRGGSRRGGASRLSESSTETVAARGRGRNHERGNKVNTVTENSFTSQPTELRRRNFNAKSVPRGFDNNRDSNNRLTESKTQSPDSMKPNRPRGRYRVDVAATDAPTVQQSPSTIAPSGLSVVTASNFGTITPTFEPEIAVTTSQPTTTSAPTTTFRTPTPTVATTVATLEVEINRRDGNSEGRTTLNAGQRRRASKEDFFNHGLGFRGRRPPIPGVMDVSATVTSSTTSVPPVATTPAARPESSARGNPGWTLRRRPGHWHDGPPSGPSANPAEAPIVDDQGSRTMPTMPTTTTMSTTTKAGRRGNKTFAKVTGGGTKDEVAESDNYPPDFKARLAQLQMAGAQPRTPMEASKMSSAELFAARSRMKLENARKLVKPELLIDETKARQVIVDPAKPKEETTTDQKPSDSEVDEDQKVYKVTRKSSSNSSTVKPQSRPKSSSIKTDWKPSKLRRNFKDSRTRTSRYKQAQTYTPRPRVSSTTIATITEKNTVDENDVDHTTQSLRQGKDQEHKYKFVPKQHGTKLRGPKPSHIEGGIQEDHHSTTKSSLAEKPRKMFTPRKNDKNYVEDVKAVALKLRKTLESMEKNQTPRPVRRSEFSEGSTTLLTTMRTVKSFSFSTRLVKTDDESATSSTMKMIDQETTPTSIATSTSSSFVTEITTQNPLENEVTTSTYENVLASSNRPSSDDTINEIENSSASSTSDSTVKSTRSPGDAIIDWQALSQATNAVTSRVDYKPRAAALTNDSGSPVFVVYPSATEKPLSIAITPKVYRYHATVKPDEDLLNPQQQQSVVQDPIISVKVSSSDVSSGDNTLQTSVVDSNNAASGNVGSTNIFNPAKSAAILETGNSTLLEQLRSTVAPLLSTLGAKSPVFSGVYKNTNSANSLPRVTPSGAPPRFSARYRGAELFVRRPTPPMNINAEKSNSARQIDVSSPGEPKVLTFYQAVESASINNEQTDVRQLWQLNNAAQVESTTSNGTNSSNSDSLIIPVTVTNTINDISPSLNDNAMTLTPDTTKTSDPATNSAMTQQPEQAVNNNESKQLITIITAADSSTSLNGLTTIESTTETSMSTSTELITEVSVSISDNMNQNNLFTTPSPLSSSDATSTETSTSETSSAFETLAVVSEESSTLMPSTLPTLLDNTETTISTTEQPAVSVVTAVTNSRVPKKLDDLNFEQPEVSNSLLDITLSSSNNDTTEPTILEIEIGQEPMKTVKLEVLSQVKSTTSDNSNSTVESTTRKLEALIIFDTSTSQPSTPTMEVINVQTPSQMNNLMTTVSMTTEAVPEISSTTESSPITTTLVAEENEATTTPQPETLESIDGQNIIDSNNTTNNLDIEIQFLNAMNGTAVPAGTEKLSAKTDGFSNKDIQSAFEKLLDSAIKLKENITSNNFVDNNLMDELMKIVEKFSNNDTNQTSFNLDENNVDSSPDGLPQLLGGFLDNTNKTHSVTNDSTVEIENNATTVVVPTKSIPITTILPEQTTTSINTNTITKINTPSSSPTTQPNSETLDTTTFFPITTIPPPSDNPINKLINNPTNANALYITRMLQIFAKLLDAKSVSQIDSLTQELDSLTPNSTEPLPVVEDVTKTALMDDSTNIVPTTMSIETQTTPDLTTITPTMLTHFQGSTPATAQRTAGTNKQPAQPITTLNPIINSLLLSGSSSTTINTNTVNPQSTIPAETTTIPEKNSANVPSSTFSPTTTTGSPTLYFTNAPPTTTQQPTTTSSYAGRFGTSRLTPAPKFSSSSSTTAPLRDYLVYGIFPNKTIVRKRPEDNLIDPRNVDSPYVIFGIYPDGKLVRKFPNGTVIPDPPSNPVEVVFSLSTTTTTTTNRPRLPDNQANNQGLRNKNVGFSNNRSPVADVNTQNAFFAPNEVDNALGGPTGFDLPIGSLGSETKEMQTPTIPNVVAGIGSPQGGRIVQDQTKDQASRTSEGQGQRNSVFIGQDKFVNYWTNGQPNSNPTVLSVNINSAATAVNEGSLSSPPSAPNFDILPNSQTGSQVTAPPGFPWKDPLDQIFGITTDFPAITASVASNTLDDPSSPNAAISARPVNKLVEIFSPVSSTINSLIKTPTKPTTTTTAAPTTQPTTTQAPTTTPMTTTQAPTTTTTTQATTTPTTPTPITMNPNAFGTTFDDLAFLNALLEKPYPGESTPKTLTEVEQLLANKILSLALGRQLTNGGPTRSPKAIQPSNSQLNSLFDDKRFTTVSPTDTSSSQPIVIDLVTTTTRRPAITSTTPFTWKPVRTFSYDSPPTTSTTTTTPRTSTTPSTTTTTTTTTTTPRPTTTTTTTTTTTPRPTTTTTTTPRSTTTTRRPTTKAPVIITAKSVTRRPRPTTTPAPPAGPFAFAANLLQAIFGRNPFAPPTTPRPVVRRPVSTARRVVPTTKRLTKTTTTTATTTTTTPAPQIVQLQSSHTPRSVQISNDAVDITNGQYSAILNALDANDKPVEVTPKAPSARQTTTFSPEDDAKFLAALLNVARNMGDSDGKSSTSAPRPSLDIDDEEFLRGILTGQAKIQPLSTAGGSDQNDAALLAALLKAQGIEPSTPPNSLREQLQQAGAAQSLQSFVRNGTRWG